MVWASTKTDPWFIGHLE